MAWSTNGRHKFSCGSVIISNKMGYYEFFTRALQPGVHYVEVDPDNLCDDLVNKVRRLKMEAMMSFLLMHATPPTCQLLSRLSICQKGVVCDMHVIYICSTNSSSYAFMSASC